MLIFDRQEGRRPYREYLMAKEFSPVVFVLSHNLVIDNRRWMRLGCWRRLYTEAVVIHTDELEITRLIRDHLCRTC